MARIIISLTVPKLFLGSVWGSEFFFLEAAPFFAKFIAKKGLIHCEKANWREMLVRVKDGLLLNFASLSNLMSIRSLVYPKRKRRPMQMQNAR